MPVIFPLTSYLYPLLSRVSTPAHVSLPLLSNDRQNLQSKSDIGAAYGTAKSGVGISSMGVMNPGLVMRNIIPVVMAGVLGIYGLIVAVILSGSSECANRESIVWKKPQHMAAVGIGTVKRARAPEMSLITPFYCCTVPWYLCAWACCLVRVGDAASCKSCVARFLCLLCIFQLVY